MYLSQPSRPPYLVPCLPSSLFFSVSPPAIPCSFPSISFTQFIKPHSFPPCPTLSISTVHTSFILLHLWLRLLLFPLPPSTLTLSSYFLPSYLFSILLLILFLSPHPTFPVSPSPNEFQTWLYLFSLSFFLTIHSSCFSLSPPSPPLPSPSHQLSSVNKYTVNMMLTQTPDFPTRIIKVSSYLHLLTSDSPPLCFAPTILSLHLSFFLLDPAQPFAPPHVTSTLPSFPPSPPHNSCLLPSCTGFLSSVQCAIKPV